MRCLALLAFAIAAGAAPHAAALEPKKPSELITLRTTGTSCSYAGSRLLGDRVLPDGTTAPFVLPEGRVLVLTGVDWFGSDAAPIGTLYLALYVEGPGTPVTLFSDGGVVADNAIVKSTAIPQAVVGGTLCALAADPLDAFSVTVHGFLAKDR